MTIVLSIAVQKMQPRDLHREGLDGKEQPFGVAGQVDLLVGAELRVRMRKVDGQPDDGLVAVVNHLVLEAVVDDRQLALHERDFGVLPDAVGEQGGVLGHLERTAIAIRVSF